MLLHNKHSALPSNPVTEEFTFHWITVQAGTSAQLLCLPNSASVSPYTGVAPKSILLPVLTCLFQDKSLLPRGAGVCEWSEKAGGEMGFWNPLTPC